MIPIKLFFSLAKTALSFYFRAIILSGITPIFYKASACTFVLGNPWIIQLYLLFSQSSITFWTKSITIWSSTIFEFKLITVFLFELTIMIVFVAFLNSFANFTLLANFLFQQLSSVDALPSLFLGNEHGIFSSEGARWSQQKYSSDYMNKLYK